MLEHAMRNQIYLNINLIWYPLRIIIHVSFWRLMLCCQLVYKNYFH